MSSLQEHTQRWMDEKKIQGPAFVVVEPAPCPFKVGDKVSCPGFENIAGNTVPTVRGLTVVSTRFFQFHENPGSSHWRLVAEKYGHRCEASAEAFVMEG
jgi:hypothetical protein